MAPKNDFTVSMAPREVIITRIFDAPIELVWRAWSEPEQFKKWWGPKHYTAPHIEMDFRVGGKYVWVMRSPDGQQQWTTGVYREIIPMERIVYTDSLADEMGNPLPAPIDDTTGKPFADIVVTVTFEAIGEKTKLTLKHAGLPSGQISQIAVAVWGEAFDKLEQSIHHIKN